MSTDVTAPCRALLEQMQAQFRERLPMWVVTERPRDFPNDYVARLHLTLPTNVPTAVGIRRPTLGELRAALPRGLHRLERSPADDPVIVEVWL